MKTIQIQATNNRFDPKTVSILREARVMRIHPGWYTVRFNGINLDASTVVSARRNKHGLIRI